MRDLRRVRPWIGAGLGLLPLLAAGWVTARLLGVHTLLFALAVQVYLMWWALFVLRVTRPALRGEWFRVRPWEPRLYGRLGVLRYRTLLQRSGWERLRRSAVGFTGTRASLPRYERSTREAEYTHLLLAGICGGLLLTAAALRAWDTCGWLLLTTVFFQIYPVLLQRTMRARLARLNMRS